MSSPSNRFPNVPASISRPKPSSAACPSAAPNTFNFELSTFNPLPPKSPYQYHSMVLTLPLFSYSYALFCTMKSLNPPVFNSLRTLFPKYREVVYRVKIPASSPHCLVLLLFTGRRSQSTVPVPLFNGHRPRIDEAEDFSRPISRELELTPPQPTRLAYCAFQVSPTRSATRKSGTTTYGIASSTFGCMNSERWRPAEWSKQLPAKMI